MREVQRDRPASSVVDGGAEVAAPRARYGCRAAPPVAGHVRIAVGGELEAAAEVRGAHAAAGPVAEVRPQVERVGPPAVLRPRDGEREVRHERAGRSGLTEIPSRPS